MKDTKGIRQVLELLAENEHKTWASWMEWLFNSECGTLNADGSFTIKPEKVDRWKYQLKVPYKLLSEEEKESDRMQVYELMPTLQEIMLGMLPEKKELSTDAMGEYTVTIDKIYVNAYNNALKDMKQNIRGGFKGE
jgi:hypothetical protein